MAKEISRESINFRKLIAEEINEAMNLSLQVFIRCNPADFDEAGLNNFKKFIGNEEYTKELSLYGAYKDERLVGVIAVKDAGQHISLFFVDEEFQGMGIGKRLFDLLLSDYNPSIITVNSSIYATEIYRKLGFSATSGPVVRDGLRFVPMQRKTEKRLKIR